MIVTKHRPHSDIRMLYSSSCSSLFRFNIHVSVSCLMSNRTSKIILTNTGHFNAGAMELDAGLVSMHPMFDRKVESIFRKTSQR